MLCTGTSYSVGEFQLCWVLFIFPSPWIERLGWGGWFLELINLGKLKTIRWVRLEEAGRVQERRKEEVANSFNQRHPLCPGLSSKKQSEWTGSLAEPGKAGGQRGPPLHRLALQGRGIHRGERLGLALPAHGLFSQHAPDPGGEGLQEPGVKALGGEHINDGVNAAVDIS